jgi:non-ribosomal peptide synthetase-like protein
MTTIGAVRTMLALPVVYGAMAGLMLLVVAAVKWAVVGRYQPFVRPLWSNFVWRLEFVNALYEFFAAPLLLETLQGTPFLPWYLRLMGAKIGRNCYIDTTGFLEWDLVELGDRTIINENAVVQTHLFEDRILKASRLRVGADCIVGATSVVLYDSVMEDHSRLDALTLLMKGETIPRGTRWIGIPASSEAIIKKEEHRNDRPPRKKSRISNYDRLATSEL